MIKIDALDKKIIKVLTQDARLSYRQIASQVGVSAVTVLNRVRRLEQQEIIRNYTIKLDFEKFGFNIEVIVEIATARGKLPELEKNLASFPNVQAVYHVTGDFDVLAILYFSDKKEASNFLSELNNLDSVGRIRSRIILKKMKQ